MLVVRGKAFAFFSGSFVGGLEVFRFVKCVEVGFFVFKKYVTIWLVGSWF